LAATLTEPAGSSSGAAPAQRDPAALARELLALAASAPDPTPLAVAAQALLSWSKALAVESTKRVRREAEAN
jgi:hypothetical protein